MDIPIPHPGLVIAYDYLWLKEQEDGLEEGIKTRLCVIVVAVSREKDRTTVWVVPITHTPPADSRLAMELPAKTKERLGLDIERSWIVLSEFNSFAWPGPDVRLVRTTAVEGENAYGYLPRSMTKTVIGTMARLFREGKAKAVKRTV